MLPLFLIILVTVTGCGNGTAEEDVKRVCESGENVESEKAESKTADGTSLITMAQLINEIDEGSENNHIVSDSDKYPLPDTVLWFNATYAPLTYSNGGDWRIVGGSELSDENETLTRFLLERDWNIEDRDSALETVERLKKEGHRKKCRECMEELEESGFLDLDEETFAQELMESGIEENIYRYVIAYYMYQEGLDADSIAAWDLCRVNQLYADFYICGYMTYEEAMDASLENSLILQEMYPSWEEMMNFYMLGYQFWKNDPVTTEDSPTMERYRYYEMLRQTENGPYSLEWDMKLEKSW